MDATADLDATRTGPTMQRARELAELDLTAGAQALGVRRRQLRSVERGRCGVALDVVERAVVVYGEDLALPSRQDLLHPTDPGLLVVGEETVRLDPSGHDDVRVLADYVAAVRRQRGVAADEPVPFRAHDLVQLARILDLGAADLRQHLVVAADLAAEEARRTARTLVVTGLCLAVAAAAPNSSAPDEPSSAAVHAASIPAAVGAAVPSAAPVDSWLARGGRVEGAPTGRSARIDALEDLMAELRSAT